MAWTISVVASCMVLPEFVQRWGTDQNQYSESFIRHERYFVGMVVGLTGYLTANFIYEPSFAFWTTFIHHTAFIVAGASVFTPLANHGFILIYGFMASIDCAAEAGYFVIYHLSANMPLKAKLAKAYQRTYVVFLLLSNALAIAWIVVHASTNPLWQTITYPMMIAVLWLPAQLLWVRTWGLIHRKCIDDAKAS